MFRRAHASLAGENAIRAIGIAWDVGHMEPGDAVGDGGEVLRRLAPKVVRIGHEPDLRKVGIVQQPERVGDPVDERHGLVLRRMGGLEPQPHACVVGGRCDLVKSGDDDRTRARVDCRPRQHEDALRLVCGEPVHARAERVDAVARLGRTFHPREAQRKDRRHGRHATRDAESGLTDEGDVRRIVFGELHLPDTDPVEARVGIGDDVFLEGRVDGGDLAEGELHRLSTGTRANTRRGSGGFVSSL